MRLTYTTALVLAALADGHRYGFRIADVTRLRVGTVYPILRRLEEEGHVGSSWEGEASAQAEGRAARRNYRLTASGRKLAAAAVERHPGLIAQLHGSAEPRTVRP
jgi:DNA-binding PadR family transcriptional regulator